MSNTGKIIQEYKQEIEDIKSYHEEMKRSKYYTEFSHLFGKVVDEMGENAYFEAIKQLTLEAREELATTKRSKHCLLYTSPSPRD